MPGKAERRGLQGHPLVALCLPCHCQALWCTLWEPLPITLLLTSPSISLFLFKYRKDLWGGGNRQRQWPKCHQVKEKLFVVHNLWCQELWVVLIYASVLLQHTLFISPKHTWAYNENVHICSKDLGTHHSQITISRKAGTKFQILLSSCFLLETAEAMWLICCNMEFIYLRFFSVTSTGSFPLFLRLQAKCFSRCYLGLMLLKATWIPEFI